MKKYRIISAIFFALVAFCALGLFACNNPDDNKATYTVTFYNQSAVVTTVTAKDGETVTLPDDPTRTGYAFAGWFIDNDPNKQFTAETAVTADMSVYARWQKSVDISFDLQGGEGNAQSISAASGSTITLPGPDGFTSGELLLAAWSDGSMEYMAGGDYTVGATSTTLTAVWGVGYEVSFDADGNGTAPEKLTRAGAFALPLGDGLNKAGYTFAGWLDGDTLYAAGAAYTPAGNVTLKAAFSGEYKITLDNNGTKTEITKQTGETLKFTMPDAPEGDYSFTGWTDGVDTYYADYEFSVGYSDVTFTAGWRERDYKISFVDWDGYVFEEKMLHKGDRITVPEGVTATTAGEFDSWSEDLSTFTVTADTVIKLQYTSDNYKTYNADMFTFVSDGNGGYLVSSVSGDALGTKTGTPLTELYFPATYRGKLVTGTVDITTNSSLVKATTSTGTGGNSLTKVVVPSTYKKIGGRMLDNSRYLTNLVIKGPIESIGSYAFDYCQSLTSFEIPATCTEIGFRAFFGMKDLQAFTVAAGNASFSTDDKGVLFNADKTKLIQYPLGSPETSYTVPASVTTLGREAFHYAGVFYGYTDFDLSQYHLQTLNFAAGSALATIEIDCFAYGCFDITLPGTFTAIDGFIEYGEDGTEYHTGLFDLLFGNVTIENGPTKIGKYAFWNYRGIKDAGRGIVTLPASVTVIDDYAFNSNTFRVYGNGLVRIDFPSGCNVNTIGAYAFAVPNDSTPYLTGFTVNGGALQPYPFDKVTKVGEYAFFNSAELKGDVTFPSVLTEIGSNAFYKSGIKKITFTGSNPTVLKTGAFASCNNLYSVNFDGIQVTDFEEGLFNSCNKLETLTTSSATSTNLPENLRIIEGAVFAQTAIKSVVIPENVSFIGQSAFYNCNQLLKVSFLGSKLEEIGTSAFEQSGITSFTCPDSVVTIGDSAFKSCPNMTSFNIGTVTSALVNFGKDVIKNCESLTTLSSRSDKIKVFGNKTKGSGLYIIEDVNGKTVKRLIFGQPNADGYFEVNDGTTDIEAEVFRENTRLKTLKLAASVENIGDRAFYCATNLTDVVQDYLPEDSKLKTIGEYAFAGFVAGAGYQSWMNIKAFRFDEGLEYIGSSAFQYNRALAEVNLPASYHIVTYEDPDGSSHNAGFTFAYCSNIKKVTFAANSTLENIPPFFLRGYEEGNSDLGEVSVTKEIVFGEGSQLKSIDSVAFGTLTNLENLVFTTTEIVTVGNNIFGMAGAPSTLKIFVPDSVLDAYKQANFWKDMYRQIYPLSQYVPSTY